MDYQTYTLINVPVSVLNILASAFFIFCLSCPFQREKIKHPLRLLLGTVVCCTITFLVSNVVQFLVQISNRTVIQTTYVVYLFSVSTSMTSCVWLNFFYYTQIVPAQRNICIWIKKNIKSIIYCIWLVEKVLSVFFISAFLLFNIALSNVKHDLIGLNSTVIYETVYSEMPSLQKIICTCAFLITVVHHIVCLWIMVVSSGSTVVYLCRHMQRMLSNGQPLSCPRFQSQVRVTVNGLLQGALYVLCVVWTLYEYFFGTMNLYPQTIEHVTVINWYMAGTTLNLGVGQGVFRQRAANMWLRAVQYCKTPKEQ